MREYGGEVSFRVKVKMTSKTTRAPGGILERTSLRLASGSEKERQKHSGKK